MTTQITETYKNVGELTVQTLTNLNIPFKGSAEGLASAFGTPTGSDALEVVSNEEMRAHGWCFSVDGVSPEVYPNEIAITAETEQITWHFGFARFYRGEWVTQCTPSYTVISDLLCKNLKSK